MLENNFYKSIAKGRTSQQCFKYCLHRNVTLRTTHFLVNYINGNNRVFAFIVLKKGICYQCVNYLLLIEMSIYLVNRERFSSRIKLFWKRSQIVGIDLYLIEISNTNILVHVQWRLHFCLYHVLLRTNKSDHSKL